MSAFLWGHCDKGFAHRSFLSLSLSFGFLRGGEAQVSISLPRFGAAVTGASHRPIMPLVLSSGKWRDIKQHSLAFAGWEDFCFAIRFDGPGGQIFMLNIPLDDPFAIAPILSGGRASVALAPRWRYATRNFVRLVGR